MEFIVAGLKITVQQVPCNSTAAAAAALAAGAAAASSSSAAATGFPAMPVPPQTPTAAAMQAAATPGNPGTPGGPEGGGQGGGVRGAIATPLAATEQHPDLSHAGAADTSLDEKGKPRPELVPQPPLPDAPGGPLDPRRKAAVTPPRGRRACPPADLVVVPRRSGRSRSTRRRSRSPRERLSRRIVAAFRDWADRTGTGVQRPITASAVRVSDMLGVSPRVLREASEIYGRGPAAPARPGRHHTTYRAVRSAHALAHRCACGGGCEGWLW